MKHVFWFIFISFVILFNPPVQAFDYPENSSTELNFPINITILETIGTYTNPSTNDSGNFTHYVIGFEIYLENYSFEIDDTSPVIENYTYDPFGQRIKISRNDTANTTIYTPFKELMRIVNSTGTYDFTYVYQDGILVARVNSDGSKFYYHPDHLGSTSLITDSNGNVVENTFYSPYGEILGGGTSDVKLYTGQFKDNVLCQYYYGARYFSPCLGRFTQPEPLIQNIYNPQSLNHYAYVLNNPYRYTDPTGHQLQPALALVGITVLTFSFENVLSQLIAQISAKVMTSYAATTTTVEAGKTTTGSPQTTGGKGVSSNANDITNQPSPEQNIGKTVESSTQGITQSSDKGKYQPKDTESVETSKGDFSLTKHAHDEMFNQGLSSYDIQKAIENNKGFRYFHKGEWKTGYYDKESKTFVATVKDIVTTVITEVGQDYVDRLRKLG